MNRSAVIYVCINKLLDVFTHCLVQTIVHLHLFVRFISHKLEYINALRFYSDHTNVRPASLHHYWQSLQVSPMRHFLWQESFHLTHLFILTARNPRQEQTTFIVHSVAGDDSFQKLGTVCCLCKQVARCFINIFTSKLKARRWPNTSIAAAMAITPQSVVLASLEGSFDQRVLR